MNNNAAASPCRSIFKGGENRPTPERYTQIWITLINRIERNRQVLTGAGSVEQRFSVGYGEPLPSYKEYHDVKGCDLLPPLGGGQK